MSVLDFQNVGVIHPTGFVQTVVRLSFLFIILIIKLLRNYLLLTTSILTKICLFYLKTCLISVPSVPKNYLILILVYLALVANVKFTQSVAS